MNFILEPFKITDDEDEDLDETVVTCRLEDEGIIFDVHNNGLSRWWNFSKFHAIQPSIIGVDVADDIVVEL